MNVVSKLKKKSGILCKLDIEKVFNQLRLEFLLNIRREWALRHQVRNQENIYMIRVHIINFCTKSCRPMKCAENH